MDEAFQLIVQHGLVADIVEPNTFSPVPYFIDSRHLCLTGSFSSGMTLHHVEVLDETRLLSEPIALNMFWASTRASTMPKKKPKQHLAPPYFEK